MFRLSLFKTIGQSLYFASNLSEISAYSGHSAYFDCILDGDSSHGGAFSWTGPAVASGRASVSMYLHGSSLVSTLGIHNVDQNDEGRYGCSYTSVGTVFITLDVILCKLPCTDLSSINRHHTHAHAQKS